MRKTILLCALALAACAEPRHYSYPPSYVAPMAPPQPHRDSSPSYVAPTPPPGAVKPLGVGALTARNVGGYIDGEERELRTDLRGSGVGVSRPGDTISLIVRDDVLFLSGPTRISPRGRQILSTIAAVAAKYDSTALVVNGYMDTAVPPDAALQLSQERAVAVSQALLAAGIDLHRIDARGFGATHLKIPTRADVHEPRNRRIEILITPKMAG
jgi:outer membrane protein OmpA-like peptidoglycan-associated protein